MSDDAGRAASVRGSLGSFVIAAEPRGLRRLANPSIVYGSITLGFSLLGGTLQVLHRSGPGPSRGRAVVSQVCGNLVVSTTGIAALLAWRRRRRGGDGFGGVPMGVAFGGGALGGLARLPIDSLAWSEGELTRTTGGLIVGSSGAWLVLAGVLTNMISGFASRVLAERERLTGALDAEHETRVLMVSAEDQLRRGIAERLHGGVQAELLVAAREARTLGGEQALALAERLDALREEEVRTLAHALHPSLVDVDLRAALAGLGELAAGAAAFELRFDDRTAGEDELAGSRLPQATRLAVHRLCEEGVSNAINHGRATRIAVEVVIAPRRVDVSVTDDGLGIERPVSGLGLRIVDSWVRAAGGTWRLEPGRSGRGSVLGAELPLPGPDGPAPAAGSTRA